MAPRYTIVTKGRSTKPPWPGLGSEEAPESPRGVFPLMFVIVCLISLRPLHGQQDTIRFSSQHEFGIDQLQQDIDVLRSALEEGHPGLYVYTSKTDLDRLFEETRAAISHPLSEFEFLRRLSPLVAAIHDGHTRLRGSLGLTAYLDYQAIRLPFKLRFLEQKAYMHRNYLDDPNVPMGGEVLSINGLPMEQVIDRMLAFMRADGANETFKYKTLEGTSNFGTYYSLAFGLTTTFDIEYRSPDDGDVHRLQVSGLTAPEVTARFTDRYPNAGFGGDPVTLSYRDGVPILKFSTFSFSSYQRAGIRYESYLRDVFAALRDSGATNLIIDIRDNGAGSDEYPKLLAAHLLRDEFSYYRSLELNDVEFDFLRLTNASQEDIPRHRLRPNDHGSFNLGGHPNLGVQTPLDPVFEGSVYVLINGGTFAAASEFASVLHNAARATFVGEEGGGAYYGKTAGFVPELTLPNTHIRVDVPMVKYRMAVDGYSPVDHGLVPDYTVVPTIDDVLANRDVELQFVLDLIGQSTPTGSQHVRSRETGS